MEIQVPSVLASLPRSLAASAGRYHFGDSTGLVASKKRKRYEVVAAVDGEGLNVYNVRDALELGENVQFPKLVTSYATPPQSSFSCAPCSVRQKDAQTSVTKRWTYCALEAPEKKIQGFLDESTDSQSNGLKVSTKTFGFGKTESPVVALTAIPSIASASQETDGDNFDVIALHRDGKIRRLSPDLEVERFNDYLVSTTDDGDRDTKAKYEVAASFFMSFEDARRTILKRRQDLIASVMADGNHSTIMITVQHPATAQTLNPSDVRVNVYSIPAHVKAGELAIAHTNGAKHLMTVKLPTPEQFTAIPPTSAKWDVSTTTGLLTLSFPSGIVDYDISHYIPQVTSSLSFEEGKLVSVLRVSPYSFMAIRGNSVAVYNTKFQSVQAYVPLKDVLAALPDKSKTADMHIEFITYFAKLDLAVAICGTALLAFDLTPLQGKNGTISRKHSRDGLLIHAIGRGIAAANKPFVPVEQQKDLPDVMKTDNTAHWAEVKAKLQACITAKDANGFDDVVRSEFPKLIDEPATEKKSKYMPSSTKFYDSEKFLFLLSKMFALKRVKDTGEYKLVVTFLPSKTYTWLINATYLTFANVKLALRQSGHLEALPPLKAGAMIQAIVEAKPSLRYLIPLLRGPVELAADELVYTIHTCLDIARKHSSAQSEEETPKALADKPHTDGQAKEEGQQQKASVATKHTFSGSEHILENAIASLNHCLTRLHNLPQSTVTSSIRSSLSNTDTLAIIQHLRHALASSGYTSRFIDELPPTFKKPSIPTLSLDTIVSILTACIDAVGPSGWVSAAAFADSANGESSLIADIKYEVSATLAGIEEATYLKGILREFIRYSETAVQAESKTPALPAAGGVAGAIEDGRSIAAGATSAIETTDQQVSRSKKLRVKRKERSNGADILVFDVPSNAVAASNAAAPSDSQLLPLSLKKQDPTDVGKTKTHKGTGEVRNRSTREMGYLRRKAVGPYSFERVFV
ncbi:hypothetical protein KEM55_002572 [Ascosphaera atra]|nr:hypothetical protein KEM55_002572 [Ascosphaera atra]